MAELTAADFDIFFKSVHGHEPFPWQRRLAELVLESGSWPKQLDLPTSSGKTAVLDVAVFTLAASTGLDQRLPRRIAFVVDRRIIVDQAAEWARRLADVLEDPGRVKDHDGQSVVRRVAEALTLGRAGARPLRVSELRGGIPRDDAWAARPDQATILVSTVDQVGSRLLFRGYGVSERMAPVHAGLLGTDTLYLLDEVHLSRPFLATLRGVGEHASGGSLGLSPSVVEMSATPGHGSSDDAFRLGANDRDPDRAPLLVKRLEARKSATIEDVRDGGDVASALAARVPAALDRMEGTVLGVVVNRVATARRIFDELRDSRTDTEYLLLTGRMRPLDRDELLEQFRHRIEAGRMRSDTGGRLVVVATQTIEAGADLDFDGLVTEIAPIDSLKQRFGRLDRLGEARDAGIDPLAIILAPRSVIAAKEPDPVYGTAIVGAYRWLRDRHGKDSFDVGAESDGLADPPPEALAPSEVAPLLLPHHVELLAQTSPKPATDPPLWPWLHGSEERSVDVNVVWRGDVTQLTELRDDAAQRSIAAALGLRPPSSAEAISLPLASARRWLVGEPVGEIADVEGQLLDEAVPAPIRQLVVRWRGSDRVEIVPLREVRPGDTVIVSSLRGGIGHRNWTPSADDPVPDLGTRANWERRGEMVLHLVGDSLPKGVHPPDLSGVVDRGEIRDRIEAWLDDVAISEALEDWFAQALRERTRGTRPSIHRLPTAGGDVSYAVRWRQPRPSFDAGAVDDLDGSDLVNSFASGRRVVPLDEHCVGVGRIAREFALRCGLPESIADDLDLAGRLHDIGKADPRFQRALLGGHEDDYHSGMSLLAKSPQFDAGDPESRASFDRSGYPSGARHELLSVALATSVEVLARQANDWDLVLHLITTHHGYSRPTAPIRPDPDPQKVSVVVDGERLTASTDHGLERVGSGIVDRFWRIADRYGPWGAAFLEAILRLADHRRSQLEREGTASA